MTVEAQQPITCIVDVYQRNRLSGALDTRAIDTDELANSLTHAAGLLLSILGALNLLCFTDRGDSMRYVIGCVVYGTTLVMLYAASTFYHGVRNERFKEILRMTDHIGIYLLIAGTYTPIMLTLLWDDCGWCLLGLVWTLAAVGITRILVTTTCSWQPYVGMGWMALLAIKPIFTSAPVDGVFWLVIGGLLYTLGVPFFVGKKRLSHAVWHLFVIAGSICHYLAVIVCVQAAR